MVCEGCRTGQSPFEGGFLRGFLRAVDGQGRSPGTGLLRGFFRAVGRAREGPRNRPPEGFPQDCRTGQSPPNRMQKRHLRRSGSLPYHAYSNCCEGPGCRNLQTPKPGLRHAPAASTSTQLAVQEKILTVCASAYLNNATTWKNHSGFSRKASVMIAVVATQSQIHEQQLHGQPSHEPESSDPAEARACQRSA